MQLYMDAHTCALMHTHVHGCKQLYMDAQICQLIYCQAFLTTWQEMHTHTHMYMGVHVTTHACIWMYTVLHTCTYSYMVRNVLEESLEEYRTQLMFTHVNGRTQP